MELYYKNEIKELLISVVKHYFMEIALAELPKADKAKDYIKIFILI